MTRRTFVVTEDMLAEGIFLDGTLKLAKGDEVGARRAFEEALKLSPGYAAPEQGLTRLNKK